MIIYWTQGQGSLLTSLIRHLGKAELDGDPMEIAGGILRAMTESSSPVLSELLPSGRLAYF
jgi:hypothetical protein